MATSGPGSSDFSASGGDLLRCPSCQKGYRIHPELLPPEQDSFNCRRCGSVISLRGIETAPAAATEDRGVLVVIHEDELAQLVLRVLGRHSLSGSVAGSGHGALAIAAGQNPVAALVSVVLPDMMGYELIDRFRRELARPIPTILLSTIHHAARYKRAPTSLYGADDHIERHHLPDMLVPKILRLIGPAADVPRQDAAQPAPKPRDEDVQDHRALERMHIGEAQGLRDPAKEEVLRMCRIIAADIVLYNGDLIGRSRAGEVMPALSKDLSEGERLLRARFPSFAGDPIRLLSEEMERVLRSRGVAVPGRDE